ncbi:MAG: short-chain dehydrogenase [Haliea sp.]|uniref:SDR family NAD(P)-dependent oxidoreductase n=1 Tax=Haliea sp. TaxID=1932666 RepID=UPI000C44CDCA|nr:SDR family NAD(P)-dependent oxidoreductase [Haliea sp.]MBM68418.1 short-chain dehydrogenase [Haliea sp.]|tara:strand:+ start:18886 stop:20346 length:1461 start_codon:yes stop_codon:yes gene_type:complete
MIELHEKIDVPRPVREAFDYVKDFRTTQEWDATASAAEKLSAGPVEVGTRFRVTCDMPVGSVDLLYTVTHLEQDKSIELHGSCRLFEVNDVIHFSSSSAGTHIDYRATFNFHVPLGPTVAALRKGMEKMGYESVQGLKTALEDNYPAPTVSASNARADRWVLPGVARFSRRGYTLGKRHWNPMSAWMGDKHAVITGATSGLGLATARSLAERGAALTLVIRNESRAQDLVNTLQRETGNPNISVEIADLSLMSEVQRLVERLLRTGRPIDVLVNNAGALFNERAETAEGLEQSFALLLLSPYRLTLGVKPLLQAAPQARVINVVSGGMYTQPLKVRWLQAREQNYSGSVAYARCKRALMVLSEQWADAWKDENIVVNAMHPGWADTPGVESALPGFHRITRRILRSPEEGADTIVWLAVATEAAKVTGALFLDREPRTTHLLSKTEDDAQEREALQPYLDSISVTAPRKGRATRSAGSSKRVAAAG